MTNPSRRRIAARAAVLLALAGPAIAQPQQLPQGPQWTPAARDAFYSTDQGSRLIPLAWIKALPGPNGAGFLADGLARYGYLPNPASPTPGLPVGFTAARDNGEPVLGMTCAACHTRQIEANGRTYRIDGGPALVDFQSFLADLNAAMGKTLADPAAFASFAKAVGQPAATLKPKASLWHLTFDAITTASLPTDSPWGVGRLDAISMIINRVAGIDVAPPGQPIIENMAVANAPARYPFLWNASVQDLTQWPAFAPNGSAPFALSRNVGEVLGVFGRFHPQKTIFGIDYRKTNSINLPGLWVLEDLITKIGPPEYPGKVDPVLRQKGREVFERRTDPNGSCADCHDPRPGGLRPPAIETWKTLHQDVKTDQREWMVLGRPIKNPGAMAGAFVPLSFPPKFLATANVPAADLLRTAVLGAIIDNLDSLLVSRPLLPGMRANEPLALSGSGDWLNWLKDPLDLEKSKPFEYESRVLQGIWAAAPYLHNGSVPTLDDLLKPVSERPASFKVGRAYDLTRLGLAVDQPAGPVSTTVTTGCDQPASGNSRCGHNFGTNLSKPDRDALLEYLKSL